MDKPLMKYISVSEFLQHKFKLTDLSPELIVNTNTIITRTNDLLERFGEFRNCNSGYRTQEDQMRINPKAPNSKHLLCLAIDLEDRDGKLNNYCKKNPKVLEDIGLWCEERQGNWQHLQAVPPASGKRWFFP